jgi:hypothetical protein
LNKILILLLLSGTLSAAQWATVTVDKAVVYSDTEMSSPIGFIKKGKRIRVGSKSRRGGRLYPLVIKKKIAYIKVDSVSTSNKLVNLQSANIRVRNSDILKNEKRVGVFYSGYASFIGIDQEASFSNDTYSDDLFYFNGFGLRGYLSKESSRTTWRVSLESSSTSTLKNEFYFLGLSADYAYDLVKFDNYVFRGYAGLEVIPFAQYSYDDLFTVNGYGGGLRAGLEMEIKFQNSFGFHVDSGYGYKKLFFILPESTNINEYNPSFNGVNFSASLSYAY